MSIKVLYLEDNVWDIELVREALSRGGQFEVKDVRSIEELKEALKSSQFDVVITDLHVLGVEGTEIIEVIRSIAPFIPIIILTGTGSEELALQYLKSGAWDYVIKSSKHIRKLPHTISSVLDRKKLLEEYETTEKALRVFKESISSLIDALPVGVLVYKGEHHIFVNKALEELTGFDRTELLRMPGAGIVHPEDQKMVKERIKLRERGFKVPESYEFRVLRKDGKVRWIEFHTRKIHWGEAEAYLGVFFDITQRKKAEREKEEAFSRLKSLLNEVVEAFSLAVEFRDPYTMGHQKRVSELSVAISNELGLDPEKIEGIRVASLLHDLGKAVGVPLEILNKPSKLNDIEFSFIKAHPEIGWRILKEVDFPWPVSEAVYQHHERLNGSGYPRGLKGDQIIIEARIIGVADVVEAMTSHRPYRPPLPLEEALKEIKENKGILYDPQVVDACLRVFEKGFSFGKD